MISEQKSEDTTVSNQRNLALLGLILVAIAPSISVITGFAFKAGLLAIFVFIFTKVWIFGLPAFWYLRIEKGEKSLSWPENGGWKVSTLLGIGMLIVIFIAYFSIGDKLLRADELTEILDSVGLTVAWKFALAIIFWVFINSVLEEYVFRWFITSKIEQLIGGVWIPIFLSAGIFTVHHTIALAFFIDPLGNFIASLGVFIGGAIFSWLYMRYRSIWVAWVAHAIADVAIFIIGWNMVIGF
ncbi:MAG: CPBP family intramembrane metalloprotease [Candidatus Poseidoniaceae archaeon]|uniref:Putative CAAX amino terminal protease-like protein n=1 Tax=uncultured Poseidoniia archaeon TaxID=1697135 RepID=A0A1B1TF70_9ARCH|nr:putative CAAX amino terminal protease-like protein [uncultured Candidatus Thalassoarchaea sp.]MBL6890901.1 CPBP family intramembrane metalloprotease [Candidatus Poseidoniaceae archaeon]